jgi:hypothetical protein
MPRIFTDAPNELKLHDNISGSTIVLFYRTPTAKEQAAYTNGMTKRERNKIINCTGEQRQKCGNDILTGFREGDFLKPGKPEDANYDKEGKGVRFSSDPASPCFDPNWKPLVAKFAPDLIEALAIHAFEQTASVDDGPDLDDGTADQD